MGQRSSKSKVKPEKDYKPSDEDQEDQNNADENKNEHKTDEQNPSSGTESGQKSPQNSPKRAHKSSPRGKASGSPRSPRRKQTPRDQSNGYTSTSTSERASLSGVELLEPIPQRNIPPRRLKQLFHVYQSESVRLTIPEYHPVQHTSREPSQSRPVTTQSPTESYSYDEDARTSTQDSDTDVTSVYRESFPNSQRKLAHKRYNKMLDLLMIYGEPQTTTGKHRLRKELQRRTSGLKRAHTAPSRPS